MAEVLRVRQTFPSEVPFELAGVGAVVGVVVGGCGCFLVVMRSHYYLSDGSGMFPVMGRKLRPGGAMHVVTTRRRVGEREYTSTLLRRSFREDGKVKKQTLANLSHLPVEAIDAIRAALRGEVLVPAGAAFVIERSLPAGHVAAALSMAGRLGLARLLDRQPSRERDLCLRRSASARSRRRRSWPRCERSPNQRRPPTCRGRRRGRPLRGARLAVGAPGTDRGSPRPPPPQRGRSRPLRRLLLVFRGANLPAGQAGYYVTGAGAPSR